MSYVRRVRPQCILESLYTTGIQKKNYSVDGFCGHCNTVFQAMRYFINNITRVKKLVHLSLRSKFKEALKKELGVLQKQYIQEKVHDVIEIYECDWWKTYKTDKFVKQHLRKTLSYKMPLREENFLKKSNLEVCSVWY